MSVTINFDQEELPGCEDIKLTDLTGEYDPDGNETGWAAPGDSSSPNPEISDISSILVDIETPDKANQTITVPLGGSFPGISNSPILVITGAQLGYGSGKKTDGKVTIKVEVTCDKLHGTPLVNNLTFITTYSFIWLCQGWCCVGKLAKKFKKGKPCNKECKPNPFEEAYSLTVQAEEAANCGDVDVAEEFRLEAEKICSTNNTKCC